MRFHPAYILSLVLAAGCVDSGRTAPRPATLVSSQPAMSWPDLTLLPGQGMGSIRFGSTQQEVRNAFGEPDRKPGPYAWEYLSGGFAVMFDHEEKVVGIFAGDGCLRGEPPTISPLVDAFQGTTAGGLRLRCSRAAIESEFASPDELRKQKPFEWLTYHQLGMKLTLYEDQLIYIILTRPRRS